jgi:crotonobetainyl-CoA:carnitine CoA-transferase CaiB-like acyl-CoA transferase
MFRCAKLYSHGTARTGTRSADRKDRMTNAATPAAAPGPLSGVRILDMATVVAAPFGATLCADWGADVIKLELPDGSDPLRGLSPVQDGVPLYWKVANRGKKGISLDVRKPEGRGLFLRLLPGIDVLVENFRPGTLDRWGLDAATLHAANPRLVVLRLTGFGQDGPASARPGFARIFEAMSGLTNLSGELGGGPLHMNYPIGDVIAGTFAAFAIASAMVRMRGDPHARGFEIDLAATEALLRLLDPLPVEYERMGTVRGPAGNLATYTAPSSMYLTRDRVWVSLVASSNPIFARLARALGRPELAGDPRFSTMQARVANCLALDAIIKEWFAARDCEEATRALDADEVPFARVQSIADITRDAHFGARGAIMRIADPELGSLPAPCIVPRIVGETLPAPRSGPAIGEHNAEVFGALGLDEQALAALRRDGVI